MLQYIFNLRLVHISGHLQLQTVTFETARSATLKTGAGIFIHYLLKGPYLHQ
ncbi:MAG: hypothetical protein GY796_11305 [Chloroflexi bacterium]|nr:hypothetical protein [Chloroflexota bacterium]